MNAPLDVAAIKQAAADRASQLKLPYAGALTPAGLGGCVIELLDRGLVDFMISTGANLYHDLHYALKGTARAGADQAFH